MAKLILYFDILFQTSRHSDENTERQTIKRSSDGTTKCSCKGSCKSKLCGCRKLAVCCSNLCKCVNCTNKDENQVILSFILVYCYKRLYNNCK